MKTSNGDLIWVSLSVKPVFDCEGKLIESKCITTNIIKLKNAEVKYRTLFDNIHLMVFTKDQNFIYKTCNELFANNFNIISEEFTGKTDYDYFPKEFVDKFRENDKSIKQISRISDLITAMNTFFRVDSMRSVNLL